MQEESPGTEVTLHGDGWGGRNQEMALAFLREMEGWPDEVQQRIGFLPASTDGNDGPTDAAGAFVDHLSLLRAGAGHLDSGASLANHDSYTFFAQIDSLLKTGPTNTNVSDIQIVLVI